MSASREEAEVSVSREAEVSVSRGAEVSASREEGEVSPLV